MSASHGAVVEEDMGMGLVSHITASFDPITRLHTIHALVFDPSHTCYQSEEGAILLVAAFIVQI